MTTVPLPRRFLATLEPITSMIFFSPEAFANYEALGLDGWSGYFCSRAASMGAVSPEVVVATFYNFSPDIVRPNVRWDLASPEQVLAARHAGARATLERVLGDGERPPRLDRAVELLRQACDACPPQGRPLAAAHARLPWPDDELLALWHGSTVLREFRGDGHIAVLISHAVGPVEAILLHTAYIGGKLDFMRVTRQWNDDAIAAGTARLVDRGFMTPDHALTDGGEKFRLMLEHETDRLAAPPFDPRARPLRGAPGPPASRGDASAGDAGGAESPRPDGPREQTGLSAYPGIVTIRSERPWWGNPLVWLAVSAVLLVLGLFVLPHFLPGVFLVLPFIWVGGWGRRRRDGPSSGPSDVRQTRQTNV